MKTAAVAALWFVSLVAVAAGQQIPGGDGITVSGTSEIKIKPTRVEIDVRVAARAELADDALVKYQQALRNALKGFRGLKLANLTIIERGMNLAPGDSAAAMQAMMRGMNPPTDKAQVEVTGPLRLQLDGIDKMPKEELFRTIGRLLDAARDTGAVIGPTGTETYRQMYYGGQQRMTSIVRFVAKDLTEVREQAYQKAVADASTRAERLARLTGTRLGPAVSVYEAGVSGDDATMMAQVYQAQAGGSSDDSEPQLTSDSFGDVPFRVKLVVRFSIAKQDVKTASGEDSGAVKLARP